MRSDPLLLALPMLLAACVTDTPPVVDAPPEAVRSTPMALAGVWRDTAGTRAAWEHWRVQDDSTLVGIGCALDGADTVSIEELRLEQRRGNWTYRVRVDRQADAGWVHFAAERITADSLVFENAGNDFPQCITYVRNLAGGWEVSVSGTDNGQERVDRYRFAAAGK